MTKFEELENEAYENSVDVITDYTFQSKRIKGLYCDGMVALNKELNHTEKACVLAEELGHHYTAVGNIIDHSDSGNRKQELKGRILSYNKMIGLQGIIRAHKHGCTSLHEAAEFLEVTESFLVDTVNYYKDKYGNTVTVGNCVVYFEPVIGVWEKK